MFGNDPNQPTKVVQLINKARKNPECNLSFLADVLTKYLGHYLLRNWCASATVEVSDSVNPYNLQLYLFDDPDQADALAYHEVNAAGNPQGKVFVRPALKYDGSISESVSHELVEMLVDPWCDYLVMGANGLLYCVEPADPVQGSPISMGGFKLANFVTPAWFSSRVSPAARTYDLQGLISKPLALLPTGYITCLDPRSGRWYQRYGSQLGKERLDATINRFSRPMRRKQRKLDPPEIKKFEKVKPVSKHVKP